MDFKNLQGGWDLAHKKVNGGPEYKTVQVEDKDETLNRLNFADEFTCKIS